MINNIHIENTQALAFSGDIHGEFKTIVNKLNNFTDAVLVVCGDIGMGFNKVDFYYNLFKILNLKLSKKNNYLLMFRGNHDDPDFFDGSFKKYQHLYLLPDYTIVSTLQATILCVGGATSVDRMDRKDYELKNRKKIFWSGELPYFDEEKLNEIGKLYADKIRIVATHTCPSFAYPTIKQNIDWWLKIDNNLEQTLDKEREIMDKLFTKLQETQKNITDWYYGHFHEHKLERHYDINFRLCDCGEINEFFGNRI